MTHILIAEDEKFIAELYKTNLQEAGFSVDIVHDGKQAMASLKRKKPDLLLLDLLMPGTDGFAVLEWIKESKDSGKYPIIVLTNLSQELSHEKCRKLGARQCIVKSDIDIDTLIDSIKKIVRGDSKRKQ